LFLSKRFETAAERNDMESGTGMESGTKNTFLVGAFPVNNVTQLGLVQRVRNTIEKKY